MPKEYELRFINYKKNILIDKLKSLGGKQIHKPVIYEYIVFKHPLNKKNTYIRVRKEFNHTTFTYKNNTNKKFVDEYEIEVSNYDILINMLYMMGFKKAYSIQKLREKWSLNNCKEIVFDTYPGLPEYMEIECDTQDNLYKTIKLLDLKEEKLFGVTDLYYNLYQIEKTKQNAKLNDLTFNTAKKIFSKRIKKNKLLFFKILKTQQKNIKYTTI
jgi:predicted adenylyl cyclase CyaB